jgi:hypothetical protein
MNKKMGRPRMPKDQAKGVLIGARFSPPEAQVIIDAVRRAGQVKSEWIRTTLLSVATST